jgi:transcriptional regulator GlxA family with amidase domain
VALARELLANSELGMERVAEKTGFSSAHQLRRVWRRWEETPPMESRKSRGHESHGGRHSVTS